jgi:uncharacterized protein YdeI (YjbR/CyaY-like superfamily)
MDVKLKVLEVRNREQWRAWLEKQHSSSAGVWLIYYKDHTGVVSVSYKESVLDALCFGWVDSLIKRLDDDRYARKFTPRKPNSKWSDSNRKRWAELKAAGLLGAAGFAAAPTGNTYAARPAIPEMPAYIAKALKADAKAWRFFRELPASERRHFVAWIHTAKRFETRERRIREALVLLAAGKKLGLK